MSILSDLKRLEKILIYKVLGSNAGHKRWQCRRYNNLKLDNIQLLSLIDAEALFVDDCDKETLRYIADMYLEHRFNYLGSGWVNVAYNAAVIGMEGQEYPPLFKNADEYFLSLKEILTEAEWIKLAEVRNYIDSDYVFINWNRDYKSGYTWRVDYIDEKESTSLPAGADVKTVWELGRLEFVLQLALAALVFKDKREAYISEFKNVVLDFMCSNPVGVGANWVLPMETAIRSVNLLLALDIIKQIDKTSVISKDVSDFFAVQIYKSGKFIFDNLEKNIKLKGSNANHYYSNVIGLLYISGYLNEYKEAKMWYRFAKKEFEKESILQFFEDGGNIEASTAYHRFMTEMMVLGAAIIKRKGRNLAESIKDRIVRATYFLNIVTKKNGNIVQLGDNDSGRIINPVMYGEMLLNCEAEDKYKNLQGYCAVYGDGEVFFDENNLNALSTIRFANGLFCDVALADGDLRNFETSLIEAIAGRKVKSVENIYDYKQKISGLSTSIEAGYSKEFNLEFERKGKREWGYFPDFGLFFVKDEALDFYVYTGGQNGRKRNGHSHNDLLHCEVSIDGEDKIFDKGTYVYIQNQHFNYFRGYKAHCVPDFGREPRRIVRAWVYEGEEKVDVLTLEPDRLVAHYVSDCVDYWRCVTIDECGIKICDYSDEEFLNNCNGQGLYSNGYGKLQDLSEGVGMQSC